MLSENLESSKPVLVEPARKWCEHLVEVVHDHFTFSSVTFPH